MYQSEKKILGWLPYDRYDRCDRWKKKTFSYRCDHVEATPQRSL